MKTSAEMAGGTAVGFRGKIRGFNADAERRLDAMLMAVGRWAEAESGVMIGHIKMSVSSDKGGITLNLTDISEGVMHHGNLRPTKEAEFHFMAALTDVDKHELEHEMIHAMEDSGVFLDFEAHHHHDGDHEHHDHKHGEDCGCGCRDGEHKHHDHKHHDHKHHRHDENCGCGDAKKAEIKEEEEEEPEPRGTCCRRKYGFR